jgi:hypothetical protein
MALTPLVTRLLGDKVKPGHRVASMGYPDVVSRPELIEAVLGKRVEELEYRIDSPAICKWHGLPEGQKIPTAESFFSLLGATLDVFDVAEVRGGEILCDLNEPMAYMPGYDFVLDVGTIEHCFNIGQAAKNMAGLLKVGGIIFHGNPHNSGNHGFYGLNPTWYADFYWQEGFELLGCCLQEQGSDDALEVPLTGRFRCDSPSMNIFAVARRTEILPIRWPIQTKYKKLIGATNGT